MRAISIMQPWAHLIASGTKKIETRSWATSYRGPIAIHASRLVSKKLLSELMEDWRFSAALNPMPIFPCGYIIAVAELVGCQQIDAHLVRELGRREHAFGDYTLGRYAWFLNNVRRIEQVMAKGQLGLWNWEPSEVAT